MPISFDCPHCGEHTEVGDEYAGQTGSCSHCGQTISIPGTPIAPPPDAVKSSGTAWPVIAIVAVVGVVGMCLIVPVLIALILPALQIGREAARKTQCANNLKEIGLAMHTYHEVYGSFPPAYIADENGQPMHSWRVLILPYMDEEALYEQYDFDERWDGPNNSRLAGLMPDAYRCPSGYKDPPYTDYVVITGPGTVFDDADGTQLGEITDDPSNTILVVESSESDVHWMEPVDLNVDEMSFSLKGVST